MTKPAPLLVLSALTSGVVGLLVVLFASDEASQFTVPLLAIAFFGLTALCGVGLVVLWGVADLLNQQRDLIDRSMRELRERQL